MKIALIGNGAMAQHVISQAAHLYDVQTLILRAEKARTFKGPQTAISTIDALPTDTTLVVDCAGHEALRAYGPDILRSGRDLITVSIGALADDDLLLELESAAREGTSSLHLCSGAIGSLDCLKAAKTGRLDSVTYIGRKPPKGWIGSPAENTLDLNTMTDQPATHFQGSAREAALTYPKNANVAAAVALAGAGMDATGVELIADPTITANIHEVHATGDFGSFSFQIAGETLPGNPRTSALAAMSVVAKINELASPIRF